MRANNKVSQTDRAKQTQHGKTCAFLIGGEQLRAFANQLKAALSRLGFYSKTRMRICANDLEANSLRGS